MKRKLLVAILLFLSFACYAQTSHMKFMGIEMGRTIDQFQAGLAKKGAKVSWMNKYAPVGQRVFEGPFSGEQAQILIWYNERTKLVYRAKAIVEREGTQSILSVLSQYEGKLDLKYGVECKETDTFEDDHLHEFKSVLYTTENGTISLFIIGEEYGDNGNFKLHIDYHDKDSYTQKIADEMDDL